MDNCNEYVISCLIFMLLVGCNIEGCVFSENYIICRLCALLLHPEMTFSCC